MAEIAASSRKDSVNAISRSRVSVDIAWGGVFIWLVYFESRITHKALGVKPSA